VAKKEDSTLVRLGENLRRVGEERSWSQEELAFKAARCNAPLPLGVLGYRSSDRAALPEADVNRAEFRWKKCEPPPILQYYGSTSFDRPAKMLFPAVVASPFVA
jgi:hypothetical protein